MNILIVFTYILGILTIIVSLITFIFRTRNKVLFFKLLSDTLVFSYCLLAYFASKEISILSSVVVTGISILRDIIFSLRNKNKVFNNISWPIGFCIIYSCSLFFVYKSPISVLPVLGSSISAISLYLKNQKYTKIGSIICETIYLIYFSILLNSSDILTIFGLLKSTAFIIGSIVGLIIIFHKERINKNHSEK